jgi:hypothetical protein
VQVILLILGVLWAGLIWSWLRERTEGHRVNSISSFNKHLSILERTSPAHQGISVVSHEPRNPLSRPLSSPAVPMAFGPVNRRPTAGMSVGMARRRRLNILVGLGAATSVTLLLALVTGARSIMYLGLLLGAALVSYVVLLARAQRIGAERRAKVRYLPSVARLARQTERSPGLLLQRPAN